MAGPEDMSGGGPLNLDNLRAEDRAISAMAEALSRTEALYEEAKSILGLDDLPEDFQVTVDGIRITLAAYADRLRTQTQQFFYAHDERDAELKGTTVEIETIEDNGESKQVRGIFLSMTVDAESFSKLAVGLITEDGNRDAYPVDKLTAVNILD